MGWDIFQMAFLDRLFPYVMRNDKVEEFMNLIQGFMSVKEYCLKFTKLSKYALELLNSKARM